MLSVYKDNVGDEKQNKPRTLRDYISLQNQLSWKRPLASLSPTFH